MAQTLTELIYGKVRPPKPPRIMRPRDLTEAQALEWLQSHDSEYDWAADEDAKRNPNYYRANMSANLKDNGADDSSDHIIFVHNGSRRGIKRWTK